MNKLGRMKISAVPPSAKDFIEFREACGWGSINMTTAKQALRGSLFVRSIHVDGNLVGFGRVVGDGALNFYIQDLIVHDQFRAKGFGKKLMTSLMDGIYDIAQPGATIGLMAAHGKEHFYQPFGFETRPNHLYGAGMTCVITSTK